MTGQELEIVSLICFRYSLKLREVEDFPFRNFLQPHLSGAVRKGYMSDFPYLHGFSEKEQQRLRDQGVSVHQGMAIFVGTKAYQDHPTFVEALKSCNHCMRLTTAPIMKA